jgi:anaerobic selenocysteine-containing dehydrogenase
MKVTVENGRLRRIEAHPQNRATPEGPCLKGLSYVERTHSPDRILHPLRRRPGAAAFDRITWDEALDTIAERLAHYRDAFGPQSVLYYAGSGTKGLLNGVGIDFWRLYGGCTTTYGDLCWPAGLEATRLTLGENKHNAPWDIENARLIILWGKNSAETNVHQTVFIDHALEKGARLVVIDPRRTQSAERASLLVQPRPGTDGAIALAVARLLIANDTVDLDFIERNVLGFSEFASSIESFTPEKAAAISDVPERAIHRLAEWIGTTAPVTINTGFGIQRYTNSGQTMRSIIALLAITGNIGRPGAGWVFADLQSYIFDAIKDPIAFYPPETSDGVVRVSISTARLGRDMLKASDPPLKAVWVERGNPVTQNPETHTVLSAFRSLDLRVVVEQFMTDTAREADIVLPAKTMFEQTDVIGAYWHPYIQLKQKVLEPPGEVKPESEIYWHLAGRLGLPAGDVAAVLPGPSDADIERYLRHRLEPFPELSLEGLAEGPVIAPGHEEVAFADRRFATPSGKIELFSAEARARWGADPLPAYEEPIESTAGRADEPASPGAADQSAGKRRRAEARAVAKARRYPLYFMTPNTKNRIHSQFNNLRTIRAVSPKPTLAINPQDADARGIEDGAMVRIFNDRGAVEVEARLDLGIKTGCVSMTNGWWITDGGTVNFCSLGRETDMGHGAAFHDNLVDVTPVV